MSRENSFESSTQKETRLPLTRAFSRGLDEELASRLGNIPWVKFLISTNSLRLSHFLLR